MLLGYVQASPRPATLSVFVTLRPRLAAPAPPDEERVSGEQDDVAQHAHRQGRLAARRVLQKCARLLPECHRQVPNRARTH